MLNFKDSEESKTYVTSDTHLNHDPKWSVPIWKMRGFNSSQEHTDDIIKNINLVVRPDDNLIHLGDFCLNTPQNKFEELISRVYCKNIYMQWGNHPNPHFKNIYKPLVKNILGDAYSDCSEVYPLRYKNIIFIGNYNEVTLNGNYAVLCHYPLYSWNYMKGGCWMLHGHEHSSILEHLPEGSNGKILDVGVDYFKKPISLSEIKEIMDTKKICSVGHH